MNTESSTYQREEKNSEPALVIDCNITILYGPNQDIKTEKGDNIISL